MTSGEGELPEGWAWSTIGAIGEVSGGIQKSPKRRPSRNPVPMLRVANVGVGQLDLADVHEIEVFDGEADRYTLKRGDLLVVEGNGSISQIGRAAMWHGDLPHCVHQNHLIRVRPFAAVPRLLELYLQSPVARGDLERVASSTSGLHVLSGAKLRRLPVPVPPLAEQDRIAVAIEEHLSRLDAVVALVRGAAVRLRQMEASLANAALDGVWPVRRLGDHTADQRYGTSARTGALGEVPVLRMGNIQAGALDWANLKYLPEDHRDFPACLLQRGDLLFNRTNSGELVGKTAVFNGAGRPTSFASYLIRVRLDDGLLPEWAALVMNSAQGRRYIDEVRTQNVGQSNVNGTKLKEFPIPVPPVSVQRDRVAEVERQRLGLRRLRTDLEAASSTAAALRRSILAAAFSGRLVAQDLLDEPADVLLARIAERRPSAGTETRPTAKSSTRQKESSS